MKLFCVDIGTQNSNPARLDPREVMSRQSGLLAIHKSVTMNQRRNASLSTPFVDVVCSMHINLVSVLESVH